MIRSILLLILLTAIAQARQSTRTSPFNTTEKADFDASSPSFASDAYFLMDNIPQHLRGNEWYAFVSLELPEDAFN